jgi:hypothetical protein
MTTYSSRGQVLYKDVLKVESNMLKSLPVNKSIEKQVENLELKLSSIRSDFEREAKLLVGRLASNKRSGQNIVNRSNKVKLVKVSEMNDAIKRIRKASNASTPPETTSVKPPTEASTLMSTLEKLNGRLESIGTRFEK